MRVEGIPLARKGSLQVGEHSSVDSSCRLLIVPLFRGSSRFESLILSHHSGFSVACECNEEDINDDDDGEGVEGVPVARKGSLQVREHPSSSSSLLSLHVLDGP